MVLHVLRLLERATAELPEIIRTDFVGEADVGGLNTDGGIFIRRHFHDALDLIYSQRNQELMLPIRMVMARLFNTALLCLLTQPQFVSSLTMNPWQQWLHQLLYDQSKYRGILEAGDTGDSLVPDARAIEALLENEELREWGSITI